MAPLPEPGSALLLQRSRVSSGTGITGSVLLGLWIGQRVRIKLREPISQFTDSRCTVVPGMPEAPPEPFRVGRHGSDAHAWRKGQYGLCFRGGTVRRPVQQMRYPRTDAYLRPVG
jgi:hypothetical protein